jgi:hypothetical protein
MKLFAAYTYPVWLILTAATGWLVFAFMRMSWQPILADEWDFYRSMVNWQQSRALIPHPQGYIHVAQFFLTLFGVSIHTARFTGMVCAVINLWLMPLLIDAFWRNHPQRTRFIAIAVAFLSFNPLTTQNAMLLDIDNTLLTPTLLMFVGIWATLQDRSARIRITLLVTLLTLAFWVKLPTPPLLLGALGFYHLLQRAWQRALELLVIGLVSFSLFLITFFSYSQLTGYLWAYFAPTFGRSSNFFNLQELIARLPQGYGIFMLWLSLPLTLILLIGLAQSARRLLRRQGQLFDALNLYIVVVCGFYLTVIVPTWGYPRYEAPIIPIVALVTAAMLTPLTTQLSRSTFQILLGVGVSVCLAFWLFFPDPLYAIYESTFAGSTFDVVRRLRVGLTTLTILGLPFIGIMVSGWFWAHRQRLPIYNVSLALLGALALASLLSLSVTLINATYSTRYRYTYDYADYFWSVREAEAVGATGYILAIKDTWLESRRQGEEIYDYLFTDNPTKLLDAMRNRRIDALIWTTKEQSRTSVLTDSQVSAHLTRCYDRQQRGVFIVYRLKPHTPCQ